MFKLSRKSRSSKTWQTKTHSTNKFSSRSKSCSRFTKPTCLLKYIKYNRWARFFLKKKFDVTWGCHQSIHHTWTAHNFKVTIIKHVMSASLPCHGLHMKILHKGIYYHVTLASPQHVCECSNNACTMHPKYPQIHNSSE